MRNWRIGVAMVSGDLPLSSERIAEIVWATKRADFSSAIDDARSGTSVREAWDAMTRNAREDREEEEFLRRVTRSGLSPRAAWVAAISGWEALTVSKAVLGSVCGCRAVPPS